MPAPDELSPERITALTMRFQGQSLEQIAKHFGVVKQTVAQWEDSPLWRAEWNLRRNDLLKRTRNIARSGALAAVAALTEIVQGIGSPLLDRHGQPEKYPNGQIKRERVSTKDRITAATALLRFVPTTEEPDEAKPETTDDLAIRVVEALSRAKRDP
jgi:hypothetical protein